MNHLATLMKSLGAWCGMLTATNLVIAQAPPDPAPLFEHFGSAVDDLFGNCVARLGDINGDGRTDYAVGSPGWNDNQGAVFVFSGYDGSELHTVTTPGSAALGFSLAGVGDVNGDSKDDFVVGNPGGGDAPGEVLVCSGAGGVIRTLTSPGQNDVFGLAAACAGDVNGDGVNDIIVGAPAVDSNGLDACGKVYVYSGATGGFLYSRLGENAEDFLGAWTAGLGDLNNDAYSEIALAAYGIGQVLIVDVHHQQVLRTLQVSDGDTPLVLGSAGDLNSDGANELIVGSSYATGSNGQVYVYDCVDGSLLRTFTGGPDEYLGTNIGGGTDINGDNVPDLLMTTRDYDYPQASRWRVHIRSGLDGSLLRSFPASAHELCPATALLESVGPDSEFGMLTANLWHDEGTGLARVFVMPPNELGLASSQTWWNAGPAPVFIAPADLNRDGRADLVTVSPSADRFSILFRNANGAYTAGGTYTTGDAPAAVAVADFDRDGDNDLALAITNENRVFLYRNSGSGFFSAIGSIKVGKRPSFLIATDLNNDNYTDIATADKYDDTVTVLLHNKYASLPLNQQFKPKVAYPVGDGPVHLAAGYLNADTRIDLVIANDAGNCLTVLNSTAQGIFNNRKDTPTDPHPACLTLSDFNGDSFTDVAYVCKGIDKAQVRQGKNNGTFKPVQRFDVGASPRAIVAIDMDLNGFADLATCNLTDETVSVLLNDMTGVFGAPTPYTAGQDPQWLVAADLNNDDALDVVAVGKTTAAASVLMNTWFAP